MLTCNICLRQFHARNGLMKHTRTQHGRLMREQDRVIPIYDQDVYMDSDNESDNESDNDSDNELIAGSTPAQPYIGAVQPIDGGQHVAPHELPHWSPLAPFSSLHQ